MVVLFGLAAIVVVGVITVGSVINPRAVIAMTNASLPRLPSFRQCVTAPYRAQPAELVRLSMTGRAFCETAAYACNPVWGAPSLR